MGRSQAPRARRARKDALVGTLFFFFLSILVWYRSSTWRTVICVSDLKRCLRTNMRCTRPTCSRRIYPLYRIDRTNSRSRSPSKAEPIHCVPFVASASLTTTNCSCTCANGTKNALYVNETRFEINSTSLVCRRRRVARVDDARSSFQNWERLVGRFHPLVASLDTSSP